MALLKEEVVGRVKYQKYVSDIGGPYFQSIPDARILFESYLGSFKPVYDDRQWMFKHFRLKKGQQRVVRYL